ncbi:LytR C-terminal domain-containing protein [Kineosporia sp. A_224]|uniref:LytR C-terminal domain-containing protein n=1 Tax=Kineosporia sp. A_224 TaxID=1962180 RepID=UPI000B4A9971|nr:LytR C-terminal domain-containing protein [Kineosporia sp. A_224]
MNTTRQRNEDQYVMPVEASRRGAHRARVSPLLGALPVVAVAVVVVGVVLLAWTLFGGSGGGTTTAEPAGGVSSAAVQPSASKPATKPAPAKTPSPAASEPSQEPTQEPSSAPASTVDKTLKIVVRNSTSTGGLARGAASKLTAKGWTINGIPDNYRPTIPSTVFYADDSQKASALAVAKVLSIDLVKQDADMASKGITAVLGSDYQR